MERPGILKLKQIDDGTGSLVVVEGDLHFDLTRAFWIFDVEEGGMRGNHANKCSQKLMVCLKGRAEVELEGKNGQKLYFTLNKKNEGLLVPILYWNKIFFYDNAILLCIASENYDEADYIRDYEVFKLL